jgi:hypothetical protein
MFRYISAGLLAAPIVYIGAHRLLAMPVVDSISLAVVPVVVAYAFVVLSMKVTLRSLRINHEAHQFIASSATRR